MFLYMLHSRIISSKIRAKMMLFQGRYKGILFIYSFTKSTNELILVKELYVYIIIMYTQRCFSSKITKMVLTVSTIVLAIMAIAHFTYAGLYGKLLNFYGDSFFGLDKKLFEKLYAPPIAYFAISGIAQIVINLIYFLLLWEFIRLTKTTLGITIGLLIFQFGMNFTIAVWSSMLWTYYEGLWKEYLNWTQQYLNSVDSRWRSFHSTVVSIFKLSAAESILTFIIILPVIVIQILMFLDRNTDYTYLEEKEIAPVPEPTLNQIEPKHK